MKEKDLGIKFWAAVAVTAIGMGVVIAFVAGFFLGHFTGHHHTTTVAAGVTTSTEEATTGSEETETTEGSTETAAAIEPFETPSTNWPVDGGNYGHEFHSSLDEVNTENVSQLKGDFLLNLHSGTAAKYSHEENVLAINGNLYIPTGEDDVIAVDASTGKEIWRHEGNLNPENLQRLLRLGVARPRLRRQRNPLQRPHRRQSRRAEHEHRRSRVGNRSLQLETR